MNQKTASDVPDAFNLGRFVSAQNKTYDVALGELRHGHKQNHWMWFIFPQIDGLGASASSKQYAIKSTDEAIAFLNHAELGPRLQECCKALIAHGGKSAKEILGPTDELKLKSSMTLFDFVNASSIFSKVLIKYFNAERDVKTLELIQKLGEKQNSADMKGQ